MRDTISGMKLHLLLLLVILFGLSIAHADSGDGCGVWGYLEETGNISCQWYNIDGSGWEYICLNEWICVYPGCESVNPPSDPKSRGIEADVTPADADRKKT